jgi:hypothetical protein
VALLRLGNRAKSPIQMKASLTRTRRSMCLEMLRYLASCGMYEAAAAFVRSIPPPIAGFDAGRPNMAALIVSLALRPFELPELVSLSDLDECCCRFCRTVLCVPNLAHGMATFTDGEAETLPQRLQQATVRALPVLVAKSPADALGVPP